MNSKSHYLHIFHKNNFRPISYINKIEMVSFLSMTKKSVFFNRFQK